MKTLTKFKYALAAMLLPLLSFGQEQNSKDTSTYFSNALFITFLVIIILLAIVIVAFSTVFKNIADSNYLVNKYAKKNDKGSSTGSVAAIAILFMLSSYSAMAGETVAHVVKDDGRIGGLDQFTFYFMVVIVLLELLVLGLMFYQFNFLVKTYIEKEKELPKVSESKIMKSLVDAVAVEEEESILLDHSYDGIKELDNNLPPWWKYGFYLTIVVSVIYLLHYHVLGTGDLQVKEYENEVAKAKLEIDEYMKSSANNVDENTVKLLTDAGDIAAGKDVFIASCAACHGRNGEGTVGPNFTDEYWLHGGSVQDIFKSVKYGWVEKGMKSWKEDLSPMQIAQVTSYIKSLKGTNPPNAKAPQGDLYSDGGTASVSDSTSLIKDSLNVMVKADTITAAKK